MMMLDKHQLNNNLPAKRMRQTLTARPLVTTRRPPRMVNKRTISSELRMSMVMMVRDQLSKPMVKTRKVLPGNAQDSPLLTTSPQLKDNRRETKRSAWLNSREQKLISRLKLRSRSTERSRSSVSRLRKSVKLRTSCSLEWLN